MLFMASAHSAAVNPAQTESSPDSKVCWYFSVDTESTQGRPAASGITHDWGAQTENFMFMNNNFRGTICRHKVKDIARLSAIP